MAYNRLTMIGVMLLPSQLAAIEVESFTNPYREIDVSASEPGIVTQIAVKEGDRVVGKQLIAQLDDRVLRASWRIAKAAMNATGKLKTARREHSMHSKRVEKLTALRERGHATQQEVDQAVSQREMAAARVQTVLDELAIKKHEWSRISVQLEQRKLTSPIDGIVNRIHLEPGEFVSMQDPSVATVVQLDPLLAVFSVPKNEATCLRVNQDVRLQIGDAAKAHTGVVEFVSPTTNAETGTTLVKVKIDNPHRLIQSGIPCVLVIDSNTVAKTNKGFKTRNVSAKSVD